MANYWVFYKQERDYVTELLRKLIKNESNPRVFKNPYLILSESFLQI